MNQSFFFVLEKVKPFLVALFSIMQPTLGRKLGFVRRSVQLFVWSIVLMLTTLPIAHLASYLAEIAGGSATVAGYFWLLIGIASVGLGTISTFYFAFFSFFGLIGGVLYGLFKTAVEKDQGDKHHS